MKLKLILAICAFGLVSACDSMMEPPTYAERSETTTLTGTIETIVPEERLFRVRDGRTSVVFRAGPQVANFGELAVGDKITLDYFESIAVGMADPADPGTPIGDVMAMAVPEGSKPGAAVASSGSTVVEFLAYDQKTHNVVIRLADGTVERIAVQPEMRSFAAARTAGDRIIVAVDRALAISVTAAK